MNHRFVPDAAACVFLSKGDTRTSPYYFARMKGVFVDFNIQIDGVLNSPIRLKQPASAPQINVRHSYDEFLRGRIDTEGFS